ncbi:MAG: class I SAM-dependent methyltransferase, partial [Pedobacter sp.]
MSIEDNSARFKSIADQLKCPTGDDGLTTAAHMAENNHNMILQTIAAMKLKEYDTVLEIGPGGGRHVGSLFNEIGNLDYYGIDISELMITEATKVNQSLLRAGNLTFSLSDGVTIDFSDNFFDKVFTVNTIYFWDDRS